MSMAPTPLAAVSAATASASAAPKMKRIAKETTKALARYFANAKWPLNKTLPRGDLCEDLAVIATKYGLDEKQVTRQLKSYKDKKYRMKDVILVFSPCAA